MGLKLKRWLIIAAGLVLTGCVVFGGVLMATQGDFSKLSATKYETNTYSIQENYENIKILADTADISFVPSQDSVVTCYGPKNEEYTVSVEDGTLTVALEKSKKWYDYIGIYSSKPKITLAIPQGEYGALTVKCSTGDLELPKEYSFAGVDVKGSTGDVTGFASVSGSMVIKLSTGDIRLENLSVGSLDLSVSTGKVTVKNVTCAEDAELNVTTGKAELLSLSCKNFTSEGETGKLTMENVIATGKIDIERSTGDVTFTKCDAAELEVETDTGDVTGSLLTDKIFFTETDTGRVEVPKSMTGGKSEISTDTGDIKITIAP